MTMPHAAAGLHEKWLSGFLKHCIPVLLLTGLCLMPAQVPAGDDDAAGFVNPGFWADADNSGNTQNAVVRFGQSMYTPEDSTRTDLITDDRPYAGLLYMGLAWNRRVHPQGAAYEMLDTRELTLGVIGSWSLAEQSQNLVHSLRGIDRFNGWDHQLHNEPAFQGALERKFKPYVGTGAVSRGWGSDMIGSSHSVNRSPFLAQAAVGISGQWLVRNRGFRLAVMRVWRTSEFDSQRGDHEFGSVALSIEF
ncbi:MAG TPA: lipid A deacylase LpxR family protein [Woeseiaceae bacterium]|nr:lipid A deacylase LpxR family protein [Woeseiaceae bacterium]